MCSCSAEVGNAMGLVRLVRAGSMQFLASALQPSAQQRALVRRLTRFVDAAVDSGAWPASDAHVAAAKAPGRLLAKICEPALLMVRSDFQALCWCPTDLMLSSQLCSLTKGRPSLCL